MQTAILEVVKESHAVVCGMCNRLGAWVKCSAASCPNRYHLPCSIAAGCELLEVGLVCSLYSGIVLYTIGVSILDIPIDIQYVLGILGTVLSSAIHY